MVQINKKKTEKNMKKIYESLEYPKKTKSMMRKKILFSHISFF